MEATNRDKSEQKKERSDSKLRQKHFPLIKDCSLFRKMHHAIKIYSLIKL